MFRSLEPFVWAIIWGECTFPLNGVLPNISKWNCVAKYYVGDVYLLYAGLDITDTKISFPLKTGRLDMEIKHCMSGLHDDVIIM